jgi:hypothetical protein
MRQRRRTRIRVHGRAVSDNEERDVVGCHKETFNSLPSAQVEWVERPTRLRKTTARQAISWLLWLRQRRTDFSDVTVSFRRPMLETEDRCGSDPRSDRA